MLKTVKRSLSNLGPRGWEAKWLRNIRSRDRQAFAGKLNSYPVSTGVRQYNEMFREDLHEPIRAAVKRGERPRVLDIGAGAGTFLGETKIFFGDKVETVATGLTRPPDVTGIDKYRVMRLSSKKFKPLEGKFDVIASVSGEVQLMGPKQITENVLSHLKPGGRAFLDIGAARIGPGGKVVAIEEGTRKFIEKEGFSVRKVVTMPAQEKRLPVTLMVIERKQ
jgi:SAM-dependent methyltransferase